MKNYTKKIPQNLTPHSIIYLTICYHFAFNNYSPSGTVIALRKRGAATLWDIH
jgi:hypothetical protein